ncbi:rod-binding protein [bacterium AH-315-J21]|nr:rod-binding protein [bacterium AH-315-J21]
MKPISLSIPIEIKSGKPEKLNPQKRVMSDLERDKVKLKKATHEFESFFMSSMLKSMRQTIPKGEENGAMGGSGLGKDIYQSMFDEELAQKMATGSSGGLGDIMYKNLVKRVEAKYPSEVKAVESNQQGLKIMKAKQ